MSCSGLHCAGCAGGAAIPVLPLAAFCGLAWVAEHLVEVAAVSAACAVMSVAIVAWLIRWQDRRQAGVGSLMVTRTDVPTLTATVIPQVSTPAAQVVEHHHYVHHAITSPDPASAIVRAAIRGQAADALTEGR